MNIIAFAASSSTTSINKKLVEYAASLLQEHSFRFLDLNDFEMPIFSEDKEAEIGKPEPAQRLVDHIESADAVIISFAEHNGSYIAAYKNIFDWCSRTKQKVYQDKKMVLLATSPGAAGAQNTLNTAIQSMPHHGGDVVASFSLSKFYENFDVDKNRINSDDIDTQFQEAVLSLTR